MKLNLNLENNKTRRILSLLLALLSACVVEYFFSFSHDFLIPITTVFVMLTAVGNLIYQSVRRFILIIIFIILLSFILPPHHLLYWRVCDVFLGGLIGIIANLLIFPRRADREFQSAIFAVLNAYETYFMAIIKLIFDKNKQSIEVQKCAVEYQLQHLPIWVFERGFDMGLQKGHQYFLMKIYQIAEILFAMQHVSRCTFDDEILNTMQEPLIECARRIQMFFKALSTVFELKKLTEGIDDFDTELFALDNKFQTLLPANLELVDMTREEVYFYEIIYDLNDLRHALIKLGQALR
jgi:hypothetical protein